MSSARLITALVLLLQSVPLVTVAADPAWIEIKSANFTVISNSSEKKAREISEGFEKIRVVFKSNFPDPSAEPNVPLVVFAVRDFDDFSQFWSGKGTRGSSVAGWFMNSGPRMYVVLRVDAKDPARSVFHEYHHMFMKRSAPWAPLWLSEGLADLWGSTIIKKRKVEVGRPDKLPINGLAQSLLIPLPELMSADYKSKYYQEWDRVCVFYAQSALFTHMLVLGEPDGERKLRNFVAMLEKGVPQEDAMRNTFGEPKVLEKRFEAYLRNLNFKYVRSTLKDDISLEEMKVRTLPAAEALGVRFHGCSQV